MPAESTTGTSQLVRPPGRVNRTHKYEVMSMQQGALILCGGHSSRMGRDKASLPFGEETMLQRIVRLVSQTVPASRIVVVCASGQQLPLLPKELLVVADQYPDQGPLRGLQTGIAAIRDIADIVYATSCDVPLLEPKFVQQMFDWLDEPDDVGLFDIVVPQDGRYFHPLAAVYRTCVLRQITELLDAEQRRPVFLFDKVRTRCVPVDQLRRIDPELRTLMNLNSPEDYKTALQAAGLSLNH